MTKKELEERVAELEAENAKLTARWDSFLADLKQSRDQMEMQAVSLSGAVEQCDLILNALQSEEAE
jgi:hypothetical protein